MYIELGWKDIKHMLYLIKLTLDKVFNSEYTNKYFECIGGNYIINQILTNSINYCKERQDDQIHNKIDGTLLKNKISLIIFLLNMVCNIVSTFYYLYNEDTRITHSFRTFELLLSTTLKTSDWKK